MACSGVLTKLSFVSGYVDTVSLPVDGTSMGLRGDGCLLPGKLIFEVGARLLSEASGATELADLSCHAASLIVVISAYLSLFCASQKKYSLTAANLVDQLIL